MNAADLLGPTYLHMLTALSAWLDKAAAQVGPDEADALLAARLAPDMFPLSTQIRFACVQAQEGMFRLSGEQFPPSLQVLLDEGRDAGERPGIVRRDHARQRGRKEQHRRLGEAEQRDDADGLDDPVIAGLFGFGEQIRAP